MVCTEQREALSAFHGCSLRTVQECGMGCLQTTRPQLPLVLQCTQPFLLLLTVTPTAKITCKDGDTTPSNTGLKRDGGFTIGCKQGWENWPGVMGWASRG